MLGVTLFGVFLTPVFFDLIQMAVDSRLFASAWVRWIGSAVTGGLLGAATGFLLARMDVGPVPRFTIGGAAIGMTAALIVPAYWRVVRARSGQSPGG
jgi:multidrug efflux pump